MNCQEITTQLQEIHLKRKQYGASVDERNLSEAFRIQPELTKLIDELKKELKPTFTIEGKEFPIFQLVVGGKTAQELENEFKKKHIGKRYFTQGTLDEMYQSEGFKKTVNNPKQIRLVRLKRNDLAISTYNLTSDQIHTRAEELGLELCPFEAGPYIRLGDVGQISNYCQIPTRKRKYLTNYVYFVLMSDEEGVGLDTNCPEPGTIWDYNHEFVFRVPDKKGNK